MRAFRFVLLLMALCGSVAASGHHSTRRDRDVAPAAVDSAAPEQVNLVEIAKSVGQVQESLDRVLTELLQYENELEQKKHAHEVDERPPGVIDQTGGDPSVSKEESLASDSIEDQEHREAEPAIGDNSGEETSGHAVEDDESNLDINRHDVGQVPVQRESMDESEGNRGRNSQGQEVSDEELVSLLKKRAKQYRSSRGQRHGSRGSHDGGEDEIQPRMHSRRKLTSQQADDEEQLLREALAGEDPNSPERGLIRRVVSRLQKHSTEPSSPTSLRDGK